MTKETEQIERDRVKRLAREYQRKGYLVLVDPDASSLPPFFAGYRPDLVVSKGSEHVAIEVKSRPTLRADKELQSIAEKIEQHAGWRLELVVVATRDDEETAKNVITPFETDQRLRTAEQLAEKRQFEFAILLSWTAAEAVLRQMAEAAHLKINKVQTAYLVKLLYSNGLLEEDDYQVLERCRRMRNRITHGFETCSSSIASTTTEFLDVVRRLFAATNNPRRNR